MGMVVDGRCPAEPVLGVFLMILIPVSYKFKRCQTCGKVIEVGS